MAKKVSPAAIFNALTATLRRTRFSRSTTLKQTDSPTETMPLSEHRAIVAPTEPARKPSDRQFARLGHSLLLISAIVAALATAANLRGVQSGERQAQSLMLRVRGPVATPDNIVILAIDDETLLQLGSSWPLRRSAYARAIDRVMQAGARTVAVNTVLDLPGFGEAETSIECSANLKISDDDRQLQQVLQRYDGRITLAIDSDRLDNRQGEQMRVALPYCPFRTPNASYGLIKYPKEPPHDQFHRLGSEALKQVRLSPEMAMLLDEVKALSFADATLRSANLSATPTGENLFFYGRDGTFSPTTISFWNVLSEENWNSDYLQRGRIFKDKIVLIGPTASKVGGEVNTAVGSMSAVELNATAIATLLENKAIRSAFPNSAIAGIVVFVLVMSAGALQIQAKQPTARFGWACAIALLWGGVGYAVFTQGLMILPIASPIAAIVVSGVAYLGTGLAQDYRHKRQLRKTLKQYVRAPFVQELIRSQDDLKDLADEHQREIIGKQIGGRYKIERILGSGGFGETYIASDTQRPGDPACVVKQLRPTSNNPKHLQLARRLFKSEAESLERLGEHDQIPRLLAYFEEDDEFYLIQEFVAGTMLSEELTIGRHLPEVRIVMILQELLNILDFVHSRNVIHRDIKPSNIIKRLSDSKLVLIDFGAVKELRNQLAEDEVGTATIGIGTQGYMPPEQCTGNPRLNSDLYAVGMIGIQALTGLPPSQLKRDSQTGETVWRDRALVSGALATILSKMVRSDFRHRYQTASAVLQDLAQLTNLSTLTLPPEFFIAAEEFEDDITTTRPWPETFGDEELPPTEPPPHA